MNTTRREVLGSMLAAYGIAAAQPGPGVTRYVRYKGKSGVSWGVLEGESIRRITGEPFNKPKPAGAAIKLGDVKLLSPADPPKIFAVGLNYRSHIGERPAPKVPEIFYKPITSLIDPGAPIIIPKTALNVHYEGELVLVIGKRATRVSKEQAREAIFGVTCGNDVSERDWQNGAAKDLQWWRAKGADTFGPCGPVLVAGIDYNRLLLQTRLNGEVVQKQTTSDLLFDPAAIVSHISQYVTLEPGDLVYTGTPGSTKKMNPGDTVEIDIEGIGILKNPVQAA
jgi:2-keto-4-pentenoate hydratase/2-oxohepta-3-ene-1,7-dioic acid hydratase in catechol pathway